MQKKAELEVKWLWLRFPPKPKRKPEPESKRNPRCRGILATTPILWPIDPLEKAIVMMEDRGVNKDGELWRREIAYWKSVKA